VSDLSPTGAPPEISTPPHIVTPPIPGGPPKAVSQSADTAGRIILHLASLGRLGNDEVAKVGYTQRGMTSALGIQQGSLAKILSRLEEADIVDSNRRHVAGEPRRLKVYRLTGLGESVARDIRHRPPRRSP
jgi:DNA-binding MarR family transcriptional regulator